MKIDRKINQSIKAGLSPGELIHVGRHVHEKVHIHQFEYSVADFSEKKSFDPAIISIKEKQGDQNWFNIEGLHNTDLIKIVGKNFEIHELDLEDILNTNHRPKTLETEKYVLLILKMVSLDENSDSLISEQVSLILGNSWLFSFQEKEGDVFDIIRNRIRENKGNLRKNKIDYLFYRLLDTIVDNYYIVSDYFHNKIETLESQILDETNENAVEDIQTLKKQLNEFRKNALPLREAISALIKENTVLIRKGTLPYLRDVHDHIVQLNDNIEFNLVALTNLMQLYQTGISNRMNQVMKTFTMIATIFIPLTFIAGIYGMNFVNMPELNNPFGYPIVLGAMVLIVGLMTFYFRKKKWI